MVTIHPFILSGGYGTRLWPLSRQAYPKQFLAVIEDGKSLFQQTCERLSAAEFAAPTVLCSAEHRFIVGEQMQDLGVSPQAIVLEPCARNTAPAAAIAALLSAQRSDDAVLMLAPSDHLIADAEAFRATVLSGYPAASQGMLVTFGVMPTGPHTGYGYIEAEGRQGKGATLAVKRFVEKPDAITAARYVASGDFYWNAGIFLVSAKAVIEAFHTHQPDVLKQAELALRHAEPDPDFNFICLDERSYAASPNISVDYAIMEKAQNVKCVPLSVQWSDLGAWPAVWEAMDKDEHGNASRGDVVFHNSTSSYAYSDGACVSVVGLTDVMVVATKDAILVTSKDDAQSVKNIVEDLNAKGRVEPAFHKRVYRPWGWFEGIDSEDRFQVKRIMVKPGEQLSMQSHYHRAEHWIAVHGTLEVTIDGETQLLQENQSVYIPLGTKHRLTNPGRIQAHLIEVQSGTYLGEDDIVRYEDVYGRRPGE
ncbi:MAG: mannose-1-phosphate guanylyltransferase/mannose-6-phosphate isomerase [Alphaproteobacteria bacterium]